MSNQGYDAAPLIEQLPVQGSGAFIGPGFIEAIEGT